MKINVLPHINYHKFYAVLWCLIRFSTSPAGAHTNVPSEYGMPSSHSQLIWFFVVYFFLFLYLRLVFLSFCLKCKGTK